MRSIYLSHCQLPSCLYITPTKFSYSNVTHNLACATDSRHLFRPMINCCRDEGGVAGVFPETGEVGTSPRRLVGTFFRGGMAMWACLIGGGSIQKWRLRGGTAIYGGCDRLTACYSLMRGGGDRWKSVSDAPRQVWYNRWTNRLVW